MKIVSFFIGLLIGIIVTGGSLNAYWRNKYEEKPTKIVYSFGDATQMYMDMIHYFELTRPILDNICTTSFFSGRRKEYDDLKIKMLYYKDINKYD